MQVIHDFSPDPVAETPGEQVDAWSQDEVDKNMIEMTCGPKLEEHFWPIRYQIRNGKLQVCGCVFFWFLSQLSFLYQAYEVSFK